MNLQISYRSQLYLQYKMFLLNDNNKIDDYFQNKHLQYKMFLLNTVGKNEELNRISIYNTKCFY